VLVSNEETLVSNEEAKAEGWGCHARTMMNTEDKSHYQAFFWVLIDLIVVLLGLMNDYQVI
jgi:hypothetical protein